MNISTNVNRNKADANEFYENLNQNTPRALMHGCMLRHEKPFDPLLHKSRMLNVRNCSEGLRSVSAIFYLTLSVLVPGGGMSPVAQLVPGRDHARPHALALCQSNSARL